MNERTDDSPTARGERAPRTLRQQLLRGGIGSITVKVCGTGLAFLVAVALARLLGPDGYGVYAFVFSLITLLTIPIKAGLQQLLVRETANGDARSEWGLVRGLWRWGDRFVGVTSAVMLTATAIFLWLGADWISADRWETLAFGLALIPLLALNEIRGSALRGLRHTVLGQLPPMTLRPGLLLGLIFLVPWIAPGFELSASSAMGLHSIAGLLTFAVATVLLYSVRPAPLRARPEPTYQSAYWRSAALPLAALTGLQLINQQADILMLGVLRSDEEVGVYRVVFQVGTLVVFGLQAANQVLQPHLARLHAQGDRDRFQRLVTVSARLILLMALPPVAAMVFFGGPLLGWLFGPAYTAGATALAILALGQLVNAAMGSTGLILNMTGHERDTVKGVGIAALSNILLNLVLIPPYGIEGAAIAMACTLVIWNLILSALVRKRLGVETVAFAHLTSPG